MAGIAANYTKFQQIQTSFDKNLEKRKRYLFLNPMSVFVI
jgi:hypothetical protein